VDGDKILLADKEDSKKLAAYVHQYKYAGNYVDRREALEYVIEHADEDPKAAEALLLQGLNDPYHGIRNIVLKNLVGYPLPDAIAAKVDKIARTDERRLNRAAAISLLGTLRRSSDEAFLVKNTADSSYSVAGAALIALSEINEAKAVSLLPALQKDARGDLSTAIEKVMVYTKNDADFDSMYQRFTGASMYDRFEESFTLLNYLSKVQQPENFKTALNAVSAFSRQTAAFAPRYRTAVIKSMQQLLKKKQASLSASSDKKAIEEEIKLLEEKLK
jgi:aminopeptidase N